MLAEVISDLIKGKDIFCRLCFVTVDLDAFNLQDEVLIDLKTNATEEIHNILEFVLGDKYTSNMTSEDIFCTKCIESARNSYIFIKMCQDKIEAFSCTIDTLIDSCENTSTDLDSFNSLFIHVNTKDFSTKQYYDNQRTVTNKTTAMTRFRSIIYGKYIRQKKKDTTEQRTRIHKYSDELSKICDIIRENNRSKFKCKGCSGIFNKSFNFKKHYYSQHSSKKFECEECGKSYGSEALLKQHKYDSHASIMCSECGKTYKNRYSLLYHMRQHSGEQPYECQYCNMKFQWSSRRAEHIRRYHLEPSVACDICQVKFRSLGSLYDHRKRHFNPNSRLHIMQPPPPVAQEEIVI